jgi:hypothetical protein
MDPRVHVRQQTQQCASRFAIQDRIIFWNDYLHGSRTGRARIGIARINT